MFRFKLLLLSILFVIIGLWFSKSIVLADYSSDIFASGTQHTCSESNASLQADGNLTTYSGAEQSCGYLFWVDLGSAQTVTKYQVNLCDSNGTLGLTGWTFQGSNDNSTYDNLDTQTPTIIGCHNWYSYEIANSTAYRYYRLDGDNTNGSTWSILDEWQGFTTIDGPTSTPTPTPNTPTATPTPNTSVGLSDDDRSAFADVASVNNTFYIIVLLAVGFYVGSYIYKNR